MKVATASQMQRLDARAIQEYGIPGIVLMENAGAGTVQALYALFPDIHSRKVAIIAGSGNNGGDGFVIGRHLINRGIEVAAFLVAAKEKVRGDARTNMDLYQKLRPIHELRGKEDLVSLREGIGRGGVVIDAMLGTGLNTPVRGVFKEIIEFINSLSVPVVAVDIPSGIDASSGKVLGTAIRAELTVTFGLPKIGLLVHPGCGHTGKLEVVDISIPRYLVQAENIRVELLEQSAVARILKPRSADAHKGTHGHLLVLAGSPGKTGAAAMTSEAALRSGAGLITLGIPSSLNAIMEAKVTEVMTEPLPETGAGTLGIASWSKIQDLMEGKQAVALGPGISTEPETQDLIHRLISNSAIPLIIDADGITALAENCTVLKKATAPVVVTPHPGEMARLLKTTVRQVQEDRIGIAESFAAAHGIHVVLKGARTIIAEPGGDVYINLTGNAGLASGGTGDVLTGMIAGFVAQGYSLSEASRLGVCLHGHIADLIAEERGEIGLTATDLLARIPTTLKAVMVSNGIVG